MTSAFISPLVRSQTSSAQVSRSGSNLKATSPRADDLRRQAQEQFNRGEAHLDRDDFPAAVRSFRESLKLARRLSDDSLASRILWKLADVHIVLLQDYEKALRFAEEALSAARAAGDRHEEARAIDHVGNAYFSLGNYAKALENFRASLTIMQQVGDRYGEAVALKDLGIASKFVGRYADALEYLYQALEIFRRLSRKIASLSALENIGMVYSTLGEYHLALDAYQQALKIEPEKGDPEATYGTLTRIGLLYLDLNDPERALQYFRQALGVIEKMKFPHHNTLLLLGMSYALSELGQEEAAIEMLRRSLNLSRESKDKGNVANNFWALGHVHMDHKPMIATAYLRRALAIMEKDGFGPTWGIYQSLAQAYHRQGDLNRAIEHYQKAIARFELVRGHLASEQYRAGLMGKHHQIYQEMVEALLERHKQSPDTGDDARAFAVYERAKARAMIEGLAESRQEIRRDLEPQLRKQEQQLGARIADLQGRLTQPRLAGTARAQILSALNEAEQESDRLVIEIKRRDPQHAALRYPEPLSLERAQALLDGRTALLAYLVTRDQIISFLLTAKTFHAERLPVPSGAAAARVQNFVDLLAQGDSAGWQNISRRLYTDLLAPVRRHLPSQINRLVIIPDDALHYLPFESLIQTGAGQARNAGSKPVSDSRPKGRYLLEDFSISYAPSATALAELDLAPAGQTSDERADLLVFANPAPILRLGAQTASQRAAERTRALYDDEGLQVTPIPSAADEARVIVRYARQGSAVYTDDDASERRVKAERLDHFRILHFASHALISDWAPRRSALVLASGAGDKEDGFLQAREIYQLKLNADLVVLSACQTARGRILAGEGVQGLAQAFFYAGAKSAVVSLWNVNDERTATFMAAFYRRLAGGQSKAAALRSAKLDLIADRATAAPRYWAPFVLIGEGDRPIPISGQWHWFRDGLGLFFGVTLALAAALLAFLVKKFSAEARS